MHVNILKCLSDDEEKVVAFLQSLTFSIIIKKRKNISVASFAQVGEGRCQEPVRKSIGEFCFPSSNICILIISNQLTILDYCTLLCFSTVTCAALC